MVNYVKQTVWVRHRTGKIADQSQKAQRGVQIYIYIIYKLYDDLERILQENKQPEAKNSDHKNQQNPKGNKNNS